MPIEQPFNESWSGQLVAVDSILAPTSFSIPAEALEEVALTQFPQESDNDSVSRKHCTSK